VVVDAPVERRRNTRGISVWHCEVSDQKKTTVVPDKIIKVVPDKIIKVLPDKITIVESLTTK
jgi:hypothetical protein